MSQGAARESTALDDQLQEFVGKPYARPTVARDPVNIPMIRHLTDALGDRNPVYTDEAFAEKSIHGGIVAPPTALQVWTMQGLAPHDADAPDDAQGRLTKLLAEHGYVGVVATDCEQTYHRYLRPGDLLTVMSEVEAITERKQTALGEGYFITTRQTYRDDHGGVVGAMRFRILMFRPRHGDAPGAGTGKVSTSQPTSDGQALATAGGRAIDARDLRPDSPPIDSRFFWDGLAEHEVRIQRCVSCLRLRHPPRPACPWCQSFDHDYVVSSGRGVVYSYVIHHQPPVPNRENPFAVVLVELDEGTRIIGNAVDIEPRNIHIGMPVEVSFVVNHQGRTLAMWRPRS